MELFLLTDIVIIFGLAVIVLLLFHLLRLPAIVGFLLTGIVAGPHGFGLIGAVHEVEVVGRVRSADVGVLAKLDVARGPLDEEPPVAPGGQPVGREPVDADVAVRPVGPQHHLAEVLEAGTVGHRGVLGQRMDDLGGLGPGEVEELVDLVAGDVAEDAAVAFAPEEPLGPGPEVLLVRPKPHGLDHPQLFMTICFAAVMDGSVYGDQCSPISDTTVLSAMCTGCDLMDHVKTQIPQASMAALLAGICWTAVTVIFV